MKKLFSFALIAAMAMQVMAQEAEKKEDSAAKRDDVHQETSVWPAFFAVCDFPANPDVTGLRLTIPFATRQCSVTGIDLGLWGKSMYFEGIQLSLIRNDVRDDLSGFQVGLYNSVGGGDLLGLQVGLWNESNFMRGFQAGLINISGQVQGFQIGLINRTETMYGYQIGLINVIRDAEVQFFPIVNIGF